MRSMKETTKLEDMDFVSFPLTNTLNYWYPNIKYSIIN